MYPFGAPRPLVIVRLIGIGMGLFAIVFAAMSYIAWG